MSAPENPQGTVTPRGLTRPHDTWAEWYDVVYDACFGDTFAWLTEATLNTVLTKATAGARIVDFGAGTGRLAIPLARLGFRVHAVEPSGPMLSQLVAKSAREADPIAITTEQIDIQSYTGRGEFDVALCVFTVLIYVTTVPELRAALKAMSDALRPGGLLLIDLPDPSVFESFTADTKDVFRIVRITRDPREAQTEPGTGFTFDEETLIKAPHLHRYHDRFPVRCSWGNKTTLPSGERLTVRRPPRGIEPATKQCRRGIGVGHRGLEPRTSVLSGLRSNHLS